MMKDMTTGALVTRALALAIAFVGIAIGPGGIASATSPHVGMVSVAPSSGGDGLASRSLVGRGIAWDDGGDSGDGGDGDDGDGD